MSSVYTVTKEDIIEEALELCGVLAADEEPSSADISSVGRSLNMLIKAWQTEGINIWAVTELEVPLEEDKKMYTIGPDQDIDVDWRPIRIVDGVYRNSDDIDIPLNIWSREEYWLLSDKESEGVPLNVYLNRRVDHGELYVWQLPSDDNSKLILQMQRGLEFPQDDDADIDFPGEYFLAVAYNLARIIGIKYGVPAGTMDALVREAERFKQEAMDYNREDTSVYIQPDNRGGYGGYS